MISYFFYRFASPASRARSREGSKMVAVGLSKANTHGIRKPTLPHPEGMPEMISRVWMVSLENWGRFLRPFSGRLRVWVADRGALRCSDPWLTSGMPSASFSQPPIKPQVINRTSLGSILTDFHVESGDVWYIGLLSNNGASLI